MSKTAIWATVIAIAITISGYTITKVWACDNSISEHNTSIGVINSQLDDMKKKTEKDHDIIIELKANQEENRRIFERIEKRLESIEQLIRDKKAS